MVGNVTLIAGEDGVLLVWFVISVSGFGKGSDEDGSFTMGCAGGSAAVP